MQPTPLPVTNGPYSAGPPFPAVVTLNASGTTCNVLPCTYNVRRWQGRGWVGPEGACPVSAVRAPPPPSFGCAMASFARSHPMLAQWVVTCPGSPVVTKTGFTATVDVGASGDILPPTGGVLK